MDDTFGKYLRLFGTIFFTFIGFIIALILLMLGIRVFFGLMSYIPWFTYLYMILIVIFPSCLFITAFLIYFKRTGNHRSKPVRIISYSVFIIALAFWVIFLVMDLLIFFKHFYGSIDMYHTYNLLFLACNVGAIFFTGVMQALTTEKEKDWMDRGVKDL